VAQRKEDWLPNCCLKRKASRRVALRNSGDRVLAQLNPVRAR